MRPSKSLTKIVLGIGASVGLALGLAQSAAAVVVTFDDVSGGGNAIITSTTSGGFDFTSTHFHVVDTPGSCLFGGCVSNGTNYAAEDAPTLAGPVTMSLPGGAIFSLVSFDGAEMFLDSAAAAAGGFANASTIHVVGNLSGGGTIVADFALDGIKDGAGGAADFETFVFGAGWTGLTSVVWSGLTAAGGGASMAFDNINATTVPEPATLLLLGAGIVGLALRRRSQKS